MLGAVGTGGDGEAGRDAAASTDDAEGGQSRASPLSSAVTGSLSDQDQKGMSLLLLDGTCNLQSDTRYYCYHTSSAPSCGRYRNIVPTGFQVLYYILKSVCRQILETLFRVIYDPSGVVTLHPGGT